jgi:hypothetical protein
MDLDQSQEPTKKKKPAAARPRNPNPKPQPPTPVERKVTDAELDNIMKKMTSANSKESRTEQDIIIVILYFLSPFHFLSFLDILLFLSAMLITFAVQLKEKLGYDSLEGRIPSLVTSYANIVFRFSQSLPMPNCLINDGRFVWWWPG